MKESKMKELDDLSGPFNPNLKFEDFSKSFLLKLIKAWQRAWLIMDIAWHDAVKERCGAEVADACALRAWLSIGSRVNPRYAKIANIELNTVLDSLKACQCPLDSIAGGIFTTEYEIINPNHVIATIRKCISLDYFEREAPDRIYPVCHEVEPLIFAKYLINPNIKVIPLKLPPRKSPDEIACQWEYRLEE
jgi:hypothetical protein